MAGQLADEGVMSAVENPNGDDRKLLVRFSTRPVKNEEQSKLSGRPIFDDVEYIEIMVPGDPYNKVCKRVDESHRQRFPRAYEAFRKGLAQDAVSGTPLSQWPGCTRGQVEEYAFLKVYTVEQLAGLSDANVQNLGMGAQAMRQKARDYLLRAADAAPVEILRAENEQARAEVATLKQQIAEQAAAMAELKKNQKVRVSQ